MTRALPRRRPAIRLGISRCLLGDRVRYDGGHKQHRFLAEVLGRHVRWVPVCPEVEAGLGTPRPAMHLVGSAAAPRIVTIAGGEDRTAALEQMARRRLPELDELDLSGFVFKSRSPSCGVAGVPLHAAGRLRSRGGAGLFARQVRKRWPLLPVEEEDRLDDPACRDHFLERVFAYLRWRALVGTAISRRKLLDFHARQRSLLLSHGLQHLAALERILQRASGRRAALAQAYGRRFMAALSRPATAAGHRRALRGLAAQLAPRLDATGRRDLRRLLADHRRGRSSRAALLRALKQCARRAGLHALAEEIYLNPHPTEWRLRSDLARKALDSGR